MRLTKSCNEKLTKIFLFWALITVSGHLSYIDTPYVNLEYVFSEASKGILDPSYRLGLEHYWELEANPLGYSILTAIFQRIFGGEGSFWSTRIPALIGSLLILFSGYLYIKERQGNKIHLFHLWCALITFSPLIWVYTGRGTAEVLPVGLVCVAFVFACLGRNKIFFYYPSAFFFTLSFFVKFHAALFGLGLVYIFFKNQKNKGFVSFIKAGFPFVLFPALILIPYFLTIYKRFGIFLLPERYQAIHSLRASIVLSVFSLYSYVLMLFLCGLSVLSGIQLWKTGRLKYFLPATLIGIAITAVSLSTPQALGEMDFGVLKHFLGRDFTILTQYIGCILCCYLIADILKATMDYHDSFLRFLVFIILPFLLISSFTRPVQRYLIFCLPFLFYFLVYYRSTVLRPIYFSVLGWGTVVIFLAYNILAVSYQIAQASACEKMAQWVQKNGYIQETAPGAIAFHAGQYFIPYSGSKKNYTVSTSKVHEDTLLHVEEVIIFGKHIRTYYLITTK